MSAQLLSNSFDSLETSNSRKGPQAARKKEALETTRLPKSFFKMVFVALTVLALMLVGWKLLDPLTLPIKHVRIEGNFQHLSTTRMQSIVADVIRGGFFNLNVMNIKEALLNEPWVEHVVVQRVWPDSLNVQVLEQIAVARWNDSSLLNTQSDVFTPTDLVQLDGIPNLYGPENSEKQIYQRYLDITEALAGRAQIEKLVLSERRAWQLKLRDGPLVVIGRNNVEARLARFTGAVIASLGEELFRLKYIDLRYTNGFAIHGIENHEKLTASGLGKNG